MDDLNVSHKASEGEDLLEDWLCRATEGICESGKATIRQEITAHYEQILEDLREEGGSVAPVAANAIDRLGNPRAARRRYEKVLMTEREEQAMNNITGRDRSSFYQFSGLNSVFLFCYFSLREGWGSLVLLIPLLLVIQYGIPKLERYGLKFILRAHFAACTGMTIALVLFVFLKSTTIPSAYLLFPGGVLMFLLYSHLKLISKSDTYPEPPDKLGSA